MLKEGRMADDRRDREEFEQISDDRDRSDMSRNNEEAVGRDTNNAEFEGADEVDDKEDSLSEGSE
jgi:hypothetical protein